ncbi:MAG: hypothetical protein ACYC8T_05950 [Myxococcaceae bacterium]
MTRAYLFAVLVLLAVPAVAAPPVAPAQPPKRVVAIIPFGKVEQPMLDEVARALRARVDVDTRIDPVRALPKAAFYPPRKRYRAEKLLDALDEQPPLGAWKAVAVTEAEISTTKEDIVDWGIAGLGNMGGRSCVLTLYIYRKHSKVRGDVARRLADLAVHEFGHTLGLDHCPMVGCVMRDAKGKALKSADTSTGQYCGRCRAGVEGGVLLPPPPLPRDPVRAPGRTAEPAP